MSVNAHASWRVRAIVAFVLSLMLSLVLSSMTYASGGAPLVKVSSDPFTNKTSQHKTEVEPDNYASGSTIVNVFQQGRFSDGGSSDNGWATSTDNGKTWQHGSFPGTTVYSSPKGIYARISDPAIAYNAKDKVWLASGLAILNEGGSPIGAAVLVNRSTDGGLTWKNAVTVAKAPNGVFFDKDWIVCDDSSSSPYYGHCYAEWDNASSGDLVQMSTSANGGKTWGAAKTTADHAYGLGGQPLVQPNGTVVVPFLSNNIAAFTSTNGGSSWSKSVTVGSANAHVEGGNLRSIQLPSAQIDGSGKVYVAWMNCQFESGCAANDIVYSTSKDGVKWSATKRVPINSVGSGQDNFIPGIAADKTTSGKSAHIAITYYYYPVSNCSISTCQLDVGFISSTNGGSTWSAAQQLAGPMKVTWLANAGGYMVGDYISTTIIGGKAFPIFALAKAPKGTMLNEAMDTTSGGLAIFGGTNSSAGDRSYHNSPNSSAQFRLTAY
ncbi:MAG TPA: sialidase family protein [Ktedonobacteraceae bacterium]|nr:sialidase family protein [Ktedonobacteraceae bacterium]